MPNHNKKAKRRKFLKKSIQAKWRSALCKKCYSDRSKNLTIMGYSSYSQYLRSQLWKNIRQNILNRDNNLCFVCGKFGNQIHHMSYDLSALNGLDATKLKCLCGNCHRAIEFKKTGEKLPIDRVNSKMNVVKSQLPPCSECGKGNSAGKCKICCHKAKYGVCKICMNRPPVRRFRKHSQKYCFYCATDLGLM